MDRHSALPCPLHLCAVNGAVFAIALKKPPLSNGRPAVEAFHGGEGCLRDGRGGRSACAVRRCPSAPRCCRRGACTSGSGRTRRNAVDLVLKWNRLRTVRLSAGGRRIFSGLVRDAGPGTLYRFGLDGDERPLPRPGLALPARRPARAVAGRRPRELSLDRRAMARRRDARARSSTRCTSAPSRRKGRGRRRAASCPSWPTLGDHRASRSCRWPSSPAGSAGATTASTCSPRRGSTARPTTSAGSSTAPTRSARRDPRRRLQPLRPGRQLPRRVLRALLHRPAYRPNGARRINFDGADCRPVREFFLANAALLDRRVPPRRPAPRRHAERSTTPRTTTSSPRSPGASREAAGGRDDHRRRRERAAGRAARAAARTQGGYGLDALWNDDFHHSAVVALTGRTRGVLHATTGARRRSSSRPPSAGYLYQGQRYAWQEKRARDAGVRPAAGGVRRPSSRTTTRSPTPARRAARTS